MSTEVARPADQPTEWQVIQAQAAVLAKSGVVPARYKDKPEDIVAAALYGRELGWGVTTSLSNIHLINGTPTLSAQGMVALVRARGHSITGEMNKTRAWTSGRRKDTGDTMQVEKLMEDMPSSLRSKQTWKDFPDSMLWARAVSQLCRSLFADVILGLSYTPEEALDFIDVDEVTAAEEAWAMRVRAAYERARKVADLGDDAIDRIRAAKLEEGIPVELPIKAMDEKQLAWLEATLDEVLDDEAPAGGEE